MTQETNSPETATESPILSEKTPLLVDRVHKRTDGGVDIRLSLDKAQTFILLEFAIMNLIAAGFLVFRDVDEEGNEVKADESTPIVVGEQVH